MATPKTRKRLLDPKSCLKTLLEKHPNLELDSESLEDLVLQHISDIPDDDPEGSYAVRAKAKMDGFRLLSEILRNKKDAETDDRITTLLESAKELRENNADPKTKDDLGL